MKAPDDACSGQVLSHFGMQLFRRPLTDGELKAAYTLAHIFALTGEDVPGRVEGFGLVLLEAAAQGLPAVVTIGDDPAPSPAAPAPAAPVATPPRATPSVATAPVATPSARAGMRPRMHT